MSWSVISAVSSYPSNSIGTVSVNSGDLICFDQSYSNTDQNPSISDDSSGGTNSYSQVGEVDHSGGSTTAHGHSWRAKAKGTETLTITVTSESDSGVHCTIVRPSNGMSATPEDGASATTSEASNSTSHTGGSVTPTSSRSVYIHTFWFQETANAVLTENGTSFTKESEESGHVSAVFDRIIASTSGSYNDAVTSDVSTSYNSITQAYLENSGGSVATINAAIGAYTWAGMPSPLSKMINATVGAWSWAGVKADVPKQILATIGSWSWAGKTSPLSTMINAAVGSYTWLGRNSPLSKMINATVGSWTWAGLKATFNVGINATVGSYTWVGVKATLAVMLNAAPGVYIWTGVAATIASGASQKSMGYYGVSFRRKRTQMDEPPDTDVRGALQSVLEARGLIEKASYTVEVTPQGSEEEVKVKVSGISRRDLHAIIVALLVSDL